MAEIREVADKVYWVELPVRGVVSIFSAYLIREPQGVLIEPGPASAVPAIQEAMRQLGMDDLAYIIPTHVHVDHAGGSGTLASLFPGAAVLAHPRGAKHMIDPTSLIESTKTVWGPGYEENLGPILPVPESQVKVPGDGEVITVDGRELQVIYAPGHAPHHMAIFDRSIRGLFCGEAVGLPGRGAEPVPIPAVAPPSFDQEQYIETMQKLRQLNADILLFSHGEVSKEPDKVISQAMGNARAFGEIMLTAMKGGAPPDEMSRRIADYASGTMGIELDETDLNMIVGGYAVYYSSKSLT